MIKKTLYFENPAYLSMKNKQLVIKIPEVGENEPFPASLTNGLMGALTENNGAVIACGENRMPVAVTLPPDGNTVQRGRIRSQIEASFAVE
jgi:CRISPR-associated protein Cas1